MPHHDPNDDAHWKPLIRRALPVFEVCAYRQGLRRGPMRDDARQEFLQRFCCHYNPQRAITQKEFVAFAKRCAQTGIQAMRLKNGYSLCGRHLIHQELLLTEPVDDDSVADHTPTPEALLQIKEKWRPRQQQLALVLLRLATKDPIAWELLDDRLSGKRTNADIARAIGHANVGLRSTKNLIAWELAREFGVSVDLAKRALYQISGAKTSRSTHGATQH